MNWKSGALAVLLLARAAASQETARDLGVTGLRSGESAVISLDGPPFERGNARRWIHPRILHALSGAPLAGVRIELWTEDESKPVHLPLQLASGVTGRDGGVHLPFQFGELRTEKARLSAPGFESRELPVSELWNDEHELFPARTLEGRVLDLDGHPIAGATLRSRQSCAHAVPAVETVTDALGRFRFDDFPELGRGVELDVFADGHGPSPRVDADELTRQIYKFGNIELRLPHRRPIDFRLFDADGRPMPHRRVTTAQRPMVSVWTDAEGRARMPPSIYGGFTVFHLSDELDSVQLQPLHAPRDRCVALRPVQGREELPEGHDAQVTLVVDGLTAEEAHEQWLELYVVGETGALASGLGEHRLPRGRALLVCGGDFSGWRTEVREIELGERPQTFTLRPIREPSIAVRLPPIDYGTLYVQAGDDSITREDVRYSEEPLAVSVPAGRPVVLWLASDVGCYRAELLALDSDAEVDLGRDECWVDRPRLSEPRATIGRMLLRVTDADDRPLPAVEIEHRVGADHESAKTDESGAASVRMPIRSHWRTSFAREGFVAAHRTGDTSGFPHSEELAVRLERRAELCLWGSVQAVQIAGAEAQRTEHGFCARLAPGWCSLRVARPGAPPVALELLLAAGESRTLVIP